MPLNALVTGTSRGIGLELATLLLDSGNQVFAIARDPEASRGLRALGKNHPDRLKLIQADVTSDRDVQALVRELGQGTPIDLLINNAGVYLDTDSKLEGASLDDIERSFQVNAIAPIRVTQALLPHLRRAARPKVANITSLMGSIGDNGSGGSYGYRASKAALNMFTKSFAIDYPGIVTMVIHPGWVRTEMGGSGAPVEPRDSAHGILRVIENAGRGDSGKFFDYEGDLLPW